MSPSAIVILVLLLVVIGVLPSWGHSRSWGYGPSGIIGFILVILIVLFILGKV